MQQVLDIEIGEKLVDFLGKGSVTRKAQIIGCGGQVPGGGEQCRGESVHFPPRVLALLEKAVKEILIPFIPGYPRPLTPRQ